VTREGLAQLVIETLDARRRFYSQHSRSEAQFEAMVALEKKLRDEAEWILEGDREDEK
jgi:hypothetical protein